MVDVRKPLKAFVNLAPIAAIAVVGFLAWSKSQSQANVNVSRPNSDRTSKHLKADRVLDGDTIRLENGESIRLCGIDAPEKSQPLGPESKAKLQQLIEQADNDVIVAEVERDRYGRIVGELFVRNKASRNPEEEFYVNGEMVRAGLAYHYKKYSANCGGKISLESAEEFAQSKKLGVWGRNSQKPWDYRKQKRA